MTRNLLLRLNITLCLIAWRIQCLAQDMEEDISDLRRKPTDDSSDMMEDFMDYQPLHISFSDILVVVLLLLSCYVFGKIWKGCSYLILAVAAVFYFLIRG